MTSPIKTRAPAIIYKMVETFEQNFEDYQRKNETELRREFLDKFFTTYGAPRRAVCWR